MPDVEFYGEKIKLREGKLPYAVTLKFARAASGTAKPMDVDATVHWLLERYCVAESDWYRFWTLLEQNDAELEDLMPVIMARFQTPVEEETQRPTERPSDSSDGPPVTPPKSETTSEAKVTQMFPGRPDRQNGILDILAEKAG